MQLSDLKGVGKNRLAQLNSAGIFTCKDLLNYFPKKYYDFTFVSPFNQDQFSKVILASAIEEPKTVRIKALNYTMCKMKDSFGNVFTAIWYNQTFIKSVIKNGFNYYLYGKISPKKKNTFVVQLTKDQNKLTFKILPVYKKLGTFGTASLQNIIEQALNTTEVLSCINSNLQNKYQLLDLKTAYKNLHFPNTFTEYTHAKDRLDIERLLPLAVKNLQQTVYSTSSRDNFYNNLHQLTLDFTKLLKFNLTKDQKDVMQDILSDLSSKKTMNRLLQGEVGSGKTIVSFYALYLAVKNGYQTAIVAPTEILASQHYANLLDVFSNTGIKIVHVSGSSFASQRREVLRLIKLGLADIVVGTHAVFSDNVQFKNLALAVIDEQHRFGVRERAKLASKGKSVDTLVMSATPIPRSMALVIYGNLSLSIIKNCPFKKDITTNIISPAKHADMWKYALEKSNEGSKIFVVCGNIGEDDDNEDALSANAVYNKIINLFGKQNVGLLHGKLSKPSQQKVMDNFANGKNKVLVSTTIIEVGVDIPEADIIIIATPEKFGLATLHQLRGRVGRNGAKSYCFCMANSNISKKTAERLVFFRDHFSGFDIAEYDYKTRGSGDIYGTSQHGVSADFSVNLANYDTALKIASDPLLTKEDAQTILQIAEEDYSKLCNDIVLN